MTSPETQAAGVAGRLRPGLIAAAMVLALYGAVAVSIDVPKTTFGIHSDEATYYLIGHSLAQDGDLEYRREDLLRAMAEYPGGPSGVFLKKGQTVDGQPDPDQQRLYYGKAFVYPLMAAPFIKIFGTNGFLLFNALLLAAMTLAAYAFLSARAGRGVSLVLALAFVFATIVPVYAFWIAPELFNCALATLAYFCWLYKEVAPAGRARWLRDGRSDLAAAAVAGLLAFSKITNAVLVVPIVLWLLWRREWKRALLASVVFWVVMLGFFGANVASSGDWNYQGGERSTFYPRPHGQPGYPFEQPGALFELGHDKARNEALTEILFDWRVFWTNLGWNAVYVVAGRHAGLLPYFFPAVFAVGALVALRRRAAPWQWLVLASGVAQVLIFIVSQPYTWNGSGGSVGNRYFMSAYGIFVFMIPPVRSIGVPLLVWAAGALFTAKIVLNPFYASYNPDEHTWRGPLRLLPVELTLVNDLPINTDIQRVRILFGTDPRFQIYYLDDNAFLREPDDAFWTRGRSTAEIFLKTGEPVRMLHLGLQAGPMPVSGTVRLGWRRFDYALQPGGVTTIPIELGDGFPYLGTRVWKLSINAGGGFLPGAFEAGSADTRFLGVKVKPSVTR
ncbi:MAG: glycosyltransferase family 39 protein [Acidobacteriota bacterium]|nr:glycosyltransferase family 39 protein [Acidobacteriota bacterium]